MSPPKDSTNDHPGETSPPVRRARRRRWKFDRRAWLAGGVFGLLAAARSALGQEPIDDSSEEEEMGDHGPLNLVLPTFGGKQLWADRLIYHDYRIQQHVVTKHHRLLDGEDRRRAWGTFEQCRTRLDEIRAEQKLPPMQGPAVLVLHGLFRTRYSMVKMAKFLRGSGEFTVLRMGYPTTRGKVADHARRLADVIANLEGITEINFVAHSLGNLVIRHYLADQTDPARGISPDPRIKRMIMLGAPNRGAQMAERFVPLDFTGQIAGPAAWELAKNWPELSQHLATPQFDFGILAGGAGTPAGRNPFIDGDDDLVVTVESTKLAGARDFRVLPVYHTTMMNDPTVQRFTLEFLRHGYFESEEKRQPIVEVAAK